MEDVRAIAVHLDALDFLRIHVARDMAALLEHEHALARIRGLPGKHRAAQPRADNEVIVFHGRSFAFSRRRRAVFWR